jgi:hypothetical protein
LNTDVVAYLLKTIASASTSSRKFFDDHERAITAVEHLSIDSLSLAFFLDKTYIATMADNEDDLVDYDEEEVRDSLP